MKYKVEITVTASYEVEVDADNFNDAILKAENIEYSDMLFLGETTEFNPQLITEIK